MVGLKRDSESYPAFFLTQVCFQDSFRGWYLMGTYGELVANYQAVERLGQSIAKSAMFGCQSEHQGIVIATDCFLSGISPLEYAKRNKIVNGKPFKQYDTMLAEFHERGGKSRLVSKTPDLASIELEFGEVKKTFSLSWEDAQQETFPYNGKEGDIVAMLAAGNKPALKPKYATPRSRAIMLFARVVSDAIRSMCPEVNYGVYTAEEIEDLPGEGAARMTPEVPTPKAPTEVKPPPTPVVVPQPQAPVTEVPQPLAGADSPPIDTTQPITDARKARIVELVKIINQAQPDFSKRLKAKLLAAGVPDGLVAGLTIAEGEELISLLERKEIDAALTMSLTKRGTENPT
jgi:hypothetical protein